MSDQAFLARLRVAAPCRVSWDSMTGNERVRFCSQCSLHVYNFSEMTDAEVRALVSRAEGRVCGRLYRRADGTVMTRDCPVGRRALRRRLARAAGASLAALLGLFTTAAAQKGRKGHPKHDEKACRIVRGLTVERSPSPSGEGSFAVEIVDPAGAAIPGATATLTDEQTGEKLAQTTTDVGVARFAIQSAGAYTLEVSSNGFKAVRARGLRLDPLEAARARVEMPLDPEAMEMGIIITDDSPPDGPGNGTTIFNSKKITSLPRG